MPSTSTKFCAGLMALAATAMLALASASSADFYAGNWTPYLHQLLNMPAPMGRLGINGADTCAEIISNKCS